MSDSTALGEFLRARREALGPQDVGLPGHGRRRVPGLRREEVALLAGVSPDYYMRSEQGRETSPSPQVVDAIATALRLDDAAHDHLRRLPRAAHARRGFPADHDRVSPALRRLLDSWPDTPAFVLGPALDVLAHNALAAALHSGFQRFDNLARMVFLDPAGRAFHRDRERAARSCVAELRAAYGCDPDSPGSPRSSTRSARRARSSPDCGHGTRYGARPSRPSTSRTPKSALWRSSSRRSPSTVSRTSSWSSTEPSPRAPPRPPWRSSVPVPIGERSTAAARPEPGCTAPGMTAAWLRRHPRPRLETQ